MADFADIAAEREQLDTALAVAAARAPQPTAPVACGLCHNCHEPVADCAQFCDADCRDDWQARKRVQP
jgi:hypothetical protein